jgi:hypothetical protein
MIKKLMKGFYIGMVATIAMFVILPAIQGVNIGGKTLAIGTSYIAQAAADPMLTMAIASSSGWFSDNKFIIGGFLLTVIFLVFGLKFAVRAVSWAFGKILGVFGGRRKGKGR